MPQFDVFHTRGSTVYPLVVDLQADLHSTLTTCVVVPMVDRVRYAQPASRLTPIVKIGTEQYVLLFPLMAAVPRTSLGGLVGSLARERATLIAALDLLVTGS